jgi:signal transduction histidine kinase
VGQYPAAAGLSRGSTPPPKLDQSKGAAKEFVDAAEEDLTASAARTRVVLVSVGLLGVVLAGVLAWRVRMAIAPRIDLLVRKIHRFHEFGIHEFGIHERTVMRGRDDIAVLSNALDVGFAAISERSRERETFLAVAAHELKTPLTSILGFVQAAVAHPEQRERALDIVRRQARRLAHLVEDLLWAAQERSGQLAFQPIPLDFAKVARDMAREVEESIPSHRIVLAAPQDGIPVLADQALITHAIWGLLTYAGVLSVADAPIDVAIERAYAQVVMEIRIRGPSLPPEDQIRMFDPFATIQYEGNTAIRSAMGLFLCRRIANLHGGSLKVDDEPGVGPIVILELPA